MSKEQFKSAFQNSKNDSLVYSNIQSKNLLSVTHSGHPSQNTRGKSPSSKFN